jgi:hypothetical protein
VLGRGSTGVVYRAVQLAVERPVALKVLHPALSRGRVVHRLQREARTTARLSHPNIVTAIDMGSVDGVWWYAMELVEGPSLAAILRRDERLSERAALRLFIPLAEALVHLEQCGVVHRDIKPANILVDSSGRARLVDLGLAFAEDDPAMTNQGGTLGTPHYVAPEQAKSAKDADARSDIWSLGASLYHAVTGRPPFPGSNVAEILSAVLYAPIPDPGELEPRLSRGLRLVLRKCLARAPERRYQRPEDLLLDLERLRERRPVLVERASLDPVAGELERRRRLRLFLAAAAALGLAVLAWLALPRVWSVARPEAQPAEGRGDPALVAALEALAARPVEDRTLLAATLEELDALRDVLPPESSGRWREVRADVQRRYQDAVGKLRSAFQRDLSQALERRDFGSALELVGPGFEARLVRELAPPPAVQAELVVLFELEARRAEVEAALAGALASVDQRLAEFLAGRVLPAAQAQARSGRWRSARHALRVAPADRLEEAAIAVEGLPRERLEQVLAGVQARLLDPALAALEADWVELDRELARWIDERALVLRAALEQRLASGAAEQLALDLHEHRAALGLEPGEELGSLADTASVALAGRTRELELFEKRLLEEDAERILFERIERESGRWAARDYGELASIWRAALEQPYLEPERQRLQNLLLEAELLEGLLERAAAGLAARAAAGRSELFVIGTIGVEGVLIAGADPLAEGFALRLVGAEGSAGDLKLGLRARPGAELLGAGEVERLAGLADGSAGAEGARDRLVRALFRWREGDLATAASLLPLGDFEDPELDLLAEDLVRRLARALEDRDLDREQRLEEAQDIERLINRVAGGGPVHPRDVAETLERIDRLLFEYADLDYVQRREPELRFLKARLAESAPLVRREDFETLFGARAVGLDSAQRRVRMEFAFDEATWGGPWSHGDWLVAGNGWEAPGVSSREQLLLEPRWPRLLLREPLDLDQPLSVELEIQQLRSSGPPQLLVLSVAGVHVALRGGGEKQPARLAIASGGAQELAELLSDLLDGGRGAPAQGLERGGTHRLRVDLTRGRGRAEVYLDGAMIGQEDRPRPSGEPGTATVVVRSLEVVRLVSAVISAGYRVR